MNIRTAMVLSSIARQYISRAAPVSSASVVEDCGLDISSATIRNEMVVLENEGYIIRPHHAAGSIPSDKGYRYYVETLKYIELPIEEQRLISHLFHQVEENLEQWLSLAVTLLSQRVQNIAIMTSPKPPACRFKHAELVSLQEHMVLIVLVLRGATIRQQLVSFEHPITQEELRVITDKLAIAYSGLSAIRISNNKSELTPDEQRVTDCILKLMKTEDGRSHQDPYMDGLHYLMNQPEFNTGHRMMNLMGLVEQRQLIEAMLNNKPSEYGTQVIIGKENQSEVIQTYSVVMSHYGIPDEAIGTIGVVGPTRMPYARTISAINFMSSMMNKLVSELYGRESQDIRKKAINN
ncbi:MAG: heat-inducible transcriptional repressor HrcA [Dehalococcoidales bacterium]|nr:heat-inducible transcriptional repressor HrcA [Dehalococcoidales bacterium]